MKKIIGFLGLICVLAFVSTLFTGLYGPEKVSAAESKTVRVATRKELKKALKDSSISTIILRTDTYDSLTITSKKAKKKKLIVDAPDADIINTARFKSIVIKNANSYIEDVSGNTITTDITRDIEIAEGRSVKKLTVTRFSTDLIIRKGASIKSLAYNVDGNKSSYDAKTRTLKIKVSELDYNTYDYYDVSYKLVIDEAGRITYLSYKDPYEKRLLESNTVYDENGNILEVKEHYADNGEVTFSQSYKYDENNNRIEADLNTKYEKSEETREYDNAGRLVRISKKTDDGHSSLSEYVYDAKSRLSESTYEYGMEGEGTLFADLTTYTYNTKGYCTKIVSESRDGYISVDTYKYDKKGNLYASVKEETFANGNKSKYQYKYEYDEYGEMTAGYIRFPGEKEWIDMSELGD